MALQVWLPLTKDLRNQGLANVTVTNNGATYNSAGKLGGCYYFNGSSTMILSSFNTTRSISFWIKAPKTNSTIAFVDYQSKMGFGFQSNGYIIANCDNTSFKMYAATNFIANEWNHIVVTRDDNLTDVTLYINGNLQTERINSNNYWTNNTDGCYIGGRSTGTYMTCYINDFRVYDHCLSPMEVKELAKGLVLHYPLNRQGWGQENLITQAMIDAEPWASAIQGTYTIDGKTGWILANNLLYSKSGNGANNIFSGLTYEADTQYTISFKWRDDYRTDGKSSSLYIRFKYSDNTYSQVISSPNYTYWKEEIMTSIAGKTVTAITTTYGNGGNLLFTDLKLEKGSIKTPYSPIVNSVLYTSMGLNSPVEYDCSGYCNNGTKVGTLTYTSDTSKYQVSTKFNGSSAIKDVDFPFSSSQWTVVFWYKFTTAPSAYQGFICLSRNAGADADKKFAAMPNSSYIWFKFESINYSLQSLKVNEWCHIAMTCDGSIGKIYENGILKYTTSSVGTILTDCDDLVVGARANSANAATTSVYLNNGSMSDVRIYATALSADDVKSLYQNCATIDPDGTIRGQIRS